MSAAGAVTLTPLTVSRPESASPDLVSPTALITSAQGAIASLAAHIPVKVGGTASPQPPVPSVPQSPAFSESSSEGSRADSTSPSNAAAPPTAFGGQPAIAVLKPLARHYSAMAIAAIDKRTLKEMIQKIAKDNAPAVALDLSKVPLELQEEYERKVYAQLDQLERCENQLTSSQAFDLLDKAIQIVAKMNELNLAARFFEILIKKRRIEFIDRRIAQLEGLLRKNPPDEIRVRLSQDLLCVVLKMRSLNLPIPNSVYNFPIVRQGLADISVKFLMDKIPALRTYSEANRLYDQLMYLLAEIRKQGLNIQHYAMGVFVTAHQRLADVEVHSLMDKIAAIKTYKEAETLSNQLKDLLIEMRAQGLSIDNHINFIESRQSSRAIFLNIVNPKGVKFLKDQLLGNFRVLNKTTLIKRWR